jgi:hypothetical protein
MEPVSAAAPGHLNPRDTEPRHTEIPLGRLDDV